MMTVGRRVQLIAHRGDPAHAPENTLASFKSAMAKGAKAVEVDVRRTADGVWVAFHDDTLQRTAGRSAYLARTGWETARTLDVGKWFSKKFAGERTPSLAEVLVLCRRRGVKVFIDVKVPSREKELLRTLRSSRWLHRTWIGAGTVASLRRWRRLLKEHPLFWVTGYHTPLTIGRVALARRLEMAGFVAYKRWVTPSVIQRVRSAGLKLCVWTVRRKSELRRFILLNVDGVMSEVWPHHLPSAPSGRLRSNPTASAVEKSVGGG